MGFSDFLDFFEFLDFLDFLDFSDQLSSSWANLQNLDHSGRPYHISSHLPTVPFRFFFTNWQAKDSMSVSCCEGAPVGSAAVHKFGKGEASHVFETLILLILDRV